MKLYQLLGCLLGLVLYAIFGLSWAFGASVMDNIDIDIIAAIESGGVRGCWETEACVVDSFAGADNGRGKYQISNIVRIEFNQFNHTNYTKNDLYNNKINSLIADWYVNKRIPQLLRHFNIPLTVENVLISYNAGIKYAKDINNGKNNMPKETKNYISKYKHLSQNI